TDVKFELVAMLDHVTLVIQDHSDSYLVNNDEITGPTKGDPLEQIGRVWAKVRGRVFTAAPASEVPLGSTADKASDFKKDLWKEYLDKVDLRLRARLPTETIKELEELKKRDSRAYDQRVAVIRTTTYEKFYEDQKELDEGARGLDAKLDQII